MLDWLSTALQNALLQLKADPYWELTAFVGEAVFGGRFILQWLVSEYKKKSHVPVAFWYMSIVGSLILAVYCIHIEKPVLMALSGSVDAAMRPALHVRKKMPAATVAITAGTASETLHPASGKDTNLSIPKTSALATKSNCFRHRISLSLFALFGKLCSDELAQLDSFFLGEANQLSHICPGNLGKLFGFELACPTAKSKSAGS